MVGSAAARRSALLSLPALLALILCGTVHETTAQKCNCSNVFESFCSPSGCGCPAGLPYTNGFIGCGPTPGSAWEVPSCKSAASPVDTINAVAVSPDGSYAVAGTYYMRMELKHVGTGDCVATAVAGSGINSLAITSDGKKIFTGDLSGDYTITVWHNGTTIKLSGHTSTVNAVAVVPGNKKLVSVGNSADNTVRVWNLTSNKLLATMTGHTDAIGGVAVSPNGTRAATCSYDGTIRIWSLTSYTLLTTLPSEYPAASVAYTPDGKRLIAGKFPNIDVWDLKTKKVIKSLKTGPREAVKSVAVSANGKFAVSGGGELDKDGYSGIIRFWNLGSFKQTYKHVVSGKGVNSVAISPNSMVAVAGANDLLVRFSVDPNTGVGKIIR